MKNIWKLLMIAMMAIAMVGCPNTGNNEEEGGESGSASVYTATIDAGMIATEKGYWGASAADPYTETIKFVLVPKSVTFEGEASFTDANKIYMYSHNDVDNGHIFVDQIPSDGWLQVSGRYDNTAYAGTAVKKNGEGYTVMIDLSKIKTSDLMSKGAAEGAKGVDTWGAFNKIATDYVPYLIGSVTGNVYVAEDNEEGYEFDIAFWNAGCIPMSSTTTAFPANVAKPTVGEAPDRVIDWTKTYYLKGGMNGWSDHAENMLIDGTAVFEYTGEDDATCDFKVSTADWNDGFMNFQIAALNTDVEGNSTDNYRLGGEADKNNAQIVSGILKNGTTYSLIFTKNGEAAFKVKLIEGGELPIVPEDSSVVEPESSEAAAESSEAAAESSEAAAESSEAAAESSEAAAESSEVAAESSEVAAESSEVAAESSEVAAESSEVAADSSNA